MRSASVGFVSNNMSGQVTLIWAQMIQLHRDEIIVVALLRSKYVGKWTKKYKSAIRWKQDPFTISTITF